MCLTSCAVEESCRDHCYVSFFFSGHGNYDCPLQFYCDECEEERLWLAGSQERRGKGHFFQLPFYPVMLHVTYRAFKIFLLVWHWLRRIQTEHWWTETAAADVCWLLVWETIVCKYSLFHSVNFHWQMQHRCSICYGLLRSGRIKSKNFSFGYRNGKKYNADRFLSLAFALFYQWKSVFRYFWRRTFLTFFLSFRLCVLSNYSKNLRI